jgi:hypothetical protein
MVRQISARTGDKHQDSGVVTRSASRTLVRSQDRARLYRPLHLVAKFAISESLSLFYWHASVQRGIGGLTCACLDLLGCQFHSLVHSLVHALSNKCVSVASLQSPTPKTDAKPAEASSARRIKYGRTTVDVSASNNTAPLPSPLSLTLI